MIKVVGLVAGLALASYLNFVIGISAAFAQTATAAIKIPSIVKVEAGQEKPLPLILESATGIPVQSMLLIRGMPSNVNLSDGRHFASGVWAVKPSSVPGLRIMAPPDIREDTHLIISLVTLEGEYLSNVLSRLVIEPAAPSPDGAQTARGGQTSQEDETEVIAAVTVERDESTKPGEADSGAKTPSLTAPPRGEPKHLTREDIQRILKLMQKGDQYLFEGKIAAARRFYQYASEMGWPDGAAAIARTYDPEHLKRFAILGGIKPDAALAKEWYGKARALGAQIEVEDLRKLGQR